MRKKELEAIEIPEITIEKADRKVDFLIEAYTAKTKKEDILVMDIYKNTKNKVFIARHFIDKEHEKYQTLFMSDQKFMNASYISGEWSKIAFNNILKQGDFYYGFCHESDIAASALSIERANRYFGQEKERLLYLITCMEQEMDWNKQMRSIDRKQQRIENLMDQVIPVTETEGFQKWIREVVFPEKYLFGETRKLKRGYRFHCSECGATYFSKEKPKHNEKSACKKCGQECITKTRVNQLYENEKVLVMQRLGESWVLRHFRFTRYSGTSKMGTNTIIYHAERIRIIDDGKKRRVYYGESHSNRESELTQTWWTTKNGMVFDHDFYLYPNELEEVPVKKGLKSALIQLSSQNIQMDYNELIRCWNVHPYLEYLIKSRLYRLADDIVRIYGTYYWPQNENLNGKATSLKELLMIETQRIHRLKDMDGGMNVLEFLQQEERTGSKISQENLEYADIHKIHLSELQIERTNLSANKMLGYIRRQAQKNGLTAKQTMQYYKDYLDMAAGRGMDLTDDIVRLQSRMIEFHNRYLEEKNKKANQKEYDRVNKKFKAIQTDYEKNMCLFGMEDEELCIIIPKKAADIVKEGQLQHHCVGASDRYMESMNERRSFILFLRKKDNQKEPYYTIEAKENGQILQFYAAYDRQPDKKKIEKWLKRWTGEVKKRQKELKKAADVVLNMAG